MKHKECPLKSQLVRRGVRSSEIQVVKATNRQKNGSAEESIELWHGLHWNRLGHFPFVRTTTHTTCLCTKFGVVSVVENTVTGQRSWGISCHVTWENELVSILLPINMAATI